MKNVKKILLTIQQWWRDVNNNIIGKVILSPITLILKILFFVGSIVLGIIGIIFIIFKLKPRNIKIETEKNKQSQNSDIDVIRDRIMDIVTSKNNYNYDNLSENEVKIYDKYTNGDILTKDEVEILKKIKNIRKPTDTIMDIDEI